MLSVDEVISHFGSKKALAEALGVSPQSLTRWRDGVPAFAAIEIERLTEGQIKAVDVPLYRDRQSA